MNDATNPEQPQTSEQPKYMKWVHEKDFVTDIAGSGLALRLERHLEKRPTQYRHSFGVLLLQHDKSLKFIMGLRPWIDRRGGRVTVKDESGLMMMLVQRMQEYIVEKEQAAENEWQKRRHDKPKGISQWGKHDKETRDAKAREQGSGS